MGKTVLELADQWAPVAKPWWSLPLLLLAMCCAVFAISPAFSKKMALKSRRIYWSGWFLASCVGALSVLHRGTKVSIAFFVFGMVMAVFAAYMYGSELKIRGRVYAFSIPNLRAEAPEAVSDEQIANSYSNLLTATKTWWLLAAMVWAVPLHVFGQGAGWDGLSVAYGSALTSLIGGAGFGDGRDGFAFVRGQKLPALVTAIGALGLLGLPIAAYAVGYFTGRTRPPRKTGKHAADPANR